MTGLLSEARDLLNYSRQLRRDFHLHPELGFKEVRTSGIVASELKKLGMVVTTSIGRTGVVGILDGHKGDQTVMLRFDMDALPIHEQTGAEYESLNPGVMHACGHDGHVSIGLTVAKLLVAHRKEFGGKVKFIFQPAEEGLGGAESMIHDGVLENPKPNICFGAHLWNEIPLGTMVINPGAMMAGSEVFTVQLTGKGGHGALPHATIDPIVATAQVISALQNIVSRNISPLDIAVVSVTAIKAGEAFNIIPETVELHGTIRSFDPDVRSKVIKRFNEITTGIASAMGCQANIDIRPMTPALVNDPEIARQVTNLISSEFPELNIDTTYQTMVSEDMAFFLQKIPGVYFMVGSANVEKGLNFGHHHPRFDFDENVLPLAAAIIACTTIHYLTQ